MNLRRIDEAIPFGLRQLEFLMRIKRLLKWRANAFDRFFTIFGFVRGVTFVILLGLKIPASILTTTNHREWSGC